MIAPVSWKVLLVDDEPDIRQIVSLVIEDAGYRVASAANGLEGLALARDLDPQIVVTDIRMPVMDGLTLLEILKKENPDIEVIVVTAFGEMELAVRALQLDASDFITKPIDQQALRVALERARARRLAGSKLKDYAAFLKAENARSALELIRTHAFQRQLIENSLEGIMVSDSDGRVVIFNPVMEALSGFGRDRAADGMHIGDFFDADEFTRVLKALECPKFGGPGRLVLFETSLRCPDGQSIPAQVSAVEMKTYDEPAGLVFLFRDLREIWKLERELADQGAILHQDKMISLGRLAASVAHEINNPLAGVLNYVRLMKRILGREDMDVVQRKKFSNYLEMVESETDRCARIISCLLTFSRKSPADFSEVAINEVLGRCVLLCRHRLELNNIELYTKMDSTDPRITGDANQVQQCVVNLVFNAADAMPRGGHLHLESLHDHQNKLVVIRVKDTGTGIRDEDLPHIFEPFFTTKQEGYGVGLGLSTVYGIMENHGGSVTVDSVPGLGTTFELRFPLEGTRRAAEPDGGRQ